MKEFDEIPTSIEVKEVQEEKDKYRIIGQIVSWPGLIMWEFNEATGQLIEAEIKEEQIQIQRSGNFMHPQPKEVRHKKVMFKKGCTYFQAINRTNAIKKLNKVFKVSDLHQQQNKKPIVHWLSALIAVFTSFVFGVVNEVFTAYVIK